MNNQIYMTIPYEVYEEARLKLEDKIDAAMYPKELVPFVHNQCTSALVTDPQGDLKFLSNQILGSMSFGLDMVREVEVTVLSGEALKRFNKIRSSFFLSPVRWWIVMRWIFVLMKFPLTTTLTKWMKTGG